MRERVALSSPDAAPAIWAGTFHAFGLEVLRKYGHLQGLESDVRIVDPGDGGQRLLDFGFGIIVQICCGFIQYKDFRSTQ